MITNRVYVQPGEHVYNVMPFSEVMMHMRLAGKRMNCEVRENSVQLLDENDRCYSIPVTLGEAGFHKDADGIYYIAFVPRYTFDSLGYVEAYGSEYVNVLDRGGNPIRYDVPIAEARALYGDQWDYVN